MKKVPAPEKSKPKPRPVEPPAPTQAIVPARAPGLQAVDPVDQFASRVAALKEHLVDETLALSKLLHDEIFEGDTNAMLTPERALNPRYQALLARVDRDDLLSRPELYELVRFAGWDRKVGGHFWKHLSLEQKKALLPLATQETIRAGAQHAIEFDLDAIQIAAWVRERNKTTGKKPRRRRLTRKTLDRTVATVLDVFGDEAALEKQAELAVGMKAAEKTELAKKMREAARRLEQAALRFAR